MRVALNQQKNGLLAVTCRLIKSTAASEVSSSIVSMRFRVSGPVSSMVCLPTRPQRGCSVGSSVSEALLRKTPRGPNCSLNLGSVPTMAVGGRIGTLSRAVAKLQQTPRRLALSLRIFCLGRHHIETDAGPIEVF